MKEDMSNTLQQYKLEKYSDKESLTNTVALNCKSIHLEFDQL